MNYRQYLAARDAASEWLPEERREMDEARLARDRTRVEYDRAGAAWVRAGRASGAAGRKLEDSKNLARVAYERSHARAIDVERRWQQVRHAREMVVKNEWQAAVDARTIAQRERQGAVGPIRYRVLDGAG